MRPSDAGDAVAASRPDGAVRVVRDVPHDGSRLRRGGDGGRALRICLGAMPNAVANMKVLVERFGPAPRAFLVVRSLAPSLLTSVNATNITLFLNLFSVPSPPS